jgi:uncharacterized protein YndB with AHSA1/START domain
MTERSTTAPVVTTPSDLEIAITRVFDAPAQLVFDAWTKPEHLKRWLGRRGDEMIVCGVDLRIGGAWRYVWSLREGGEMGMHGEYQEVVPFDRLVTTEIFDEPYFEEMGSGTINTFTFEERDGRTTLTVTTLYKTRAQRDAVLVSGMESGVGESYDRLDDLLRSMA